MAMKRSAAATLAKIRSISSGISPNQTTCGRKVPRLPQAGEFPRSEEPDVEQDDDDQGEDATADVHRLALLSAFVGIEVPDLPCRSTVESRGRGGTGRRGGFRSRWAERSLEVQVLSPALIDRSPSLLLEARAKPDFDREWPRLESNQRAQIRSLPLYPLSYGAVPSE